MAKTYIKINLSQIKIYKNIFLQHKNIQNEKYTNKT